MSGTSGSLIRRMAGLVAAVAGLALIAAPAAFAADDTITAQATVQFSGAVDNPASCNGPTSATIDWGDGTTSTAGSINGNVVSGTHTYAAAGSDFGTVHLTGGGCANSGSGTDDFFTANVSAAPPMFTQCPAVYQNNGCQFLITIGNGSQVVTQDPNQGPYEGADDALIGVQNNSSSPVSQLPLAVPNSALFGFEEDGICTPGGPPVPAGCVPQAGGPAGTTCDTGQGGFCSFPAPPGQPAGYVEPGASVRRHAEQLRGPDELVLERKLGRRAPASSISRRQFLREGPPTSASRSRRSARRSASAAPRLHHRGFRHRRSRARASRSRRS